MKLKYLFLTFALNVCLFAQAYNKSIANEGKHFFFQIDSTKSKEIKNTFKTLEKDDYLKIEAESTTSSLDKWHIIKEGEPNYIVGASNKAQIEFLGNNPDTGEPNSPLIYTFVAPKDGNFRLLMMSSKRLEGVRGDMCNDAYVKIDGDFQSATNLDISVLKNYIKYFQEGSVKTPENAWHWGIRAERGKHEFFNLIYALKKGQKYTLTLAGRSQRFNVDYLVLYDNDKIGLKDAQMFFAK